MESRSYSNGRLSTADAGIELSNMEDPFLEPHAKNAGSRERPGKNSDRSSRWYTFRTAHVDSESSEELKRKNGRFSGWRAGMYGVTGLILVILVVNLAFLIWASSHKEIHNGVGTLKTGSCRNVENTNTWMHLLINILGTGLLGGSNYSMQRLAAPTRKEIDRAHGKHKWLDIGIPSFRNLRHVHGYRVLAWLVLALSSLPLHFFYNSAVFNQITASDFDVFVVDESFLSGAKFDVSAVAGGPAPDPGPLSNSLDWLQQHAGSLTRRESIDCRRDYAQDFVTSVGDVLLVVNSTGPPPSDSVYAYFLYDSTSPDSFYWMCERHTDTTDPCALEEVLSYPTWSLAGHDIAYCLVQDVEEQCNFQFSVTVLVIVIVCNVIKLITMVVILWGTKEQPIVTSGDAVATFLDRPDEATKGICLADKEHFFMNRWEENTPAQAWKSERKFWFAAPSAARWLLCNVAALGGIIACSALLGRGISDYRFQTNRSLKALEQLGFGTINISTIVDFQSLSLNLLTSTLLANLPQFVLSVLYFGYNAIFTSELVSQEWNEFGSRRKPLRVSAPVGEQVSTYWLGLPYVYGVTLAVFSILLHWLYSRSLFLVNIQFVDPIPGIASGAVEVEYDTGSTSLRQVGFSPYAIIISIILTSLVLIVGLVFGFRRYRPGIPLAASCSAAISAACHPEADESKDLALYPVKWGVTSEQAGVGHCTFSRRNVPLPIEGEVYSGLKIE